MILFKYTNNTHICFVTVNRTVRGFVFEWIYYIHEYPAEPKGKSSVMCVRDGVILIISLLASFVFK